MEIIRTTNVEELNALYNNSALTWEGLSLEEDNLDALKGWLNQYTSLINERIYVTTGKLMNDTYNLTGSNAYPNDLNIVSIMLDDIENPSAIFISRFDVGGRWFDDIVDNNARREEAV